MDISQGYSFVLTVTGSEASFEGGSYGTWSDIGVDRDQARHRGLLRIHQTIVAFEGIRQRFLNLEGGGGGGHLGS